MLRPVIAALLLGSALLGAATADSLHAREANLAASMRCPVCQNQTLAESNAPLAASMRQQIREQLAQGRSDAQIRDYFEQRYGAFVRYDPPFTPSTWLLWLGPFLLLAAGFAALWRLVSRRARAMTEPLTEEEQARADSLLEGRTP
ncbi:cytochrome c-type biogenesis protein [Ramlibacter sp. PS3R-8]|uniref:cytochrome c-type biogenesis protein n=1 Tax=Ramlibacter sp. PS3R-8 TaxID=3133437 RepID=UPI00309D60BC